MNEKTAMNIDLRDVQEKMEDSARTAQDYGRKAVLATIGFWGLAYDKAQDMWKVGNEWVEKAEKRGEELEHEWTQEFNKLQKQPEVKKVVDYVEDQVDGVSKNAKSVVNEVEKFLAQFNPNKVEEVAKDVVIKVESALAELFPSYDELPAKEIVAKLPAFKREQLVEIREYEVANKNRVTVLREIDVLLETPEVVAA
jgi:hypothetical protein